MAPIELRWSVVPVEFVGTAPDTIAELMETYRRIYSQAQHGTSGIETP